MRALAVVTPSLFEKTETNKRHLIEIDDLKIPLALINGTKPNFDAELEQFADLVLIKKTSFSLNYRDLGVIEMAWDNIKGLEQDTYYPIGSDFAGYVEAVGKNVTALKKGDLVMGNCFYPDIEDGALPGIPSNHSSREYEVYHFAKLIKVPSYISHIEAGSLTIGTQTAVSMVKKGNIKKGDNVLITAITSNTAFFLLNALWEKECNVYGLSYSGKNIDKTKEHFPFVKEIFSVKQNDIPENIFFDVVLDAFSDTHLEDLAQKLNINARYVTCGIFNQSRKKNDAVTGTNLSLLIPQIIARNVSYIGNCLGTTQDLTEGLRHYENHKMVIDTVFTENDSLTDFISKAYNLNNDKFGKVVYHYE